jgi:hypothetical protein
MMERSRTIRDDALRGGEAVRPAGLLLTQRADGLRLGKSAPPSRHAS